MPDININVTLTKEQAGALAKLISHLDILTITNIAETDKEAHLMMLALNRIAVIIAEQPLNNKQ
jgi:phenylpyruvate tautomerase PptA (4-oxalocrotonate tautomerase family)